MEIYIKPVKKFLTRRREVKLGDIADVISPDKTVGNVRLRDITSAKKTSMLVSVTDIIRALKERYPDATVVNLGESETLILYTPASENRSKMLGRLKIAFVAIVLFVGSSTAIMSFYTDAQMNKIFSNMYYIIMGEQEERPLLIAIPYCIGLAAGIIMFFNHVGGKKFDGEPTPIEVQMESYDGEVTDTVISALAEKRGNSND